MGRAVALRQTVDRRLNLTGLPNIQHQAEVKKALPHLSTIEMMEMLDHFSGYYNRLYTSATGVESQQWLFNEILDVGLLHSEERRTQLSTYL